MHEFVTPVGGTARDFTYDASGDIATDSRVGGLGMTFQYDVEGRLSRASRSNAPTTQYGTYAYDAQNRLASRTVMSGSTTGTVLYVHDINDHIIAETDAAGLTLREYIWMNDMPIAVVDNVNTATRVLYYVHTDHLGRPARMVRQNWSPVWDVIYSPFGAVSYLVDATTKNDMRFPGQWFQLESGLAYNWHRHYDASLGRYVQPDPIGYAGGRSLYGYAGQNPLANVDPLGLRPLTDHEKDLLHDFIPQDDLDNGDIRTGEMPFYVADWASGFTSGNVMYFRDPNKTFCNAKDLMDLGHELVHVGQYRKGMTYFTYMAESARALREGKHQYYGNKYEEEAYEIGRQIWDALKKKDCSCPEK